MKASRRPRVLMLLENNPYPRDYRVRREASALTGGGYDVTVIAPAAKGQPWYEVVDGVTVYRFPAPPAANGFAAYLLEYGYAMAATFGLSLLVFLRAGFDIVHAHNPPDTFVFIAAFYKAFGCRFVFDHHDLSPEMYCARFPGRANRLVYHTLVGLEKISCRMADHVIATNQSYMAIEKQRGRVPEHKITVVRNGPDLNRMRLIDTDPDLCRKGRILIGYVGIMGFQDGVDYLLRALHHLVYDLKRTDFYCVLIGRGDAWNSLKALATQLRLDGYVWFTGGVSDADLRRYLSAAHVCVAPEPSNPFNDRSTMIKVMEYMAMEKPIVAFDLPEHRVTAEEAALYVAPNDELEFARGLATLMDDPERRLAMGRFGRQRVEAALAWQYSAQNLVNAYRGLTGSALSMESPHANQAIDQSLEKNGLRAKPNQRVAQ